MSEKIDNLLNELYAYDADFKKHEPELKTLLASLLSSQPDTEFDPLFAESLRKKLLIRAQGLQSGRTGFSLNKIFSIKILAPVGLVAVVGLLAYGAYHKQVLNPTKLVSNNQNNGQKLAPNAFGSLVADASLATARSQSGGGGPVAAENQATASAPANGDAKMAAPNVAYGMGGATDFMPVFEIFTYTYAGEKVDLKDSMVSVLRKQKGFGSTSGLGGLFSGIEGLNSSALQNPQLDNVTVNEDRDFGYTVNINYTQGTINFNENWLRWQTPDRYCTDQTCIDRYRLKIEDVPSDEEIIKISNDFLSQYGISTKNYGAPTVQKQWLQTYAATQDKAQAWIPDMQSVVYPQVINGQTVYDEAGNPSGLTVNVNIRVKKVSNVYEISRLVYDSSDYEAVTDWDLVLKAALSGSGNVFYPTEGMARKNVELKLGTPKFALVKQYKYEPGKDTYEILVPSLVFPVLNPPVDNYYSNAITVPLVKELLDAKLNPAPLPGQPVPLTAPSARAESIPVENK